MRFSENTLIERYILEDKSDKYFPLEDPVLIDVGAHHGSFSKNFALAGWRIIAFEPEKKNRSAFEKNLATFEQVSCIPKAVSDTNGDRVPFFTSNEHFGIHTLKPFHQTHKLAYEVETVRLDTILRELAIPSVTLLKIDIEGADFPALQSFDFEQHRPKLVMVEFMDDRSMSNYGYTHHQVASFMKTRGYMTFISEWKEIKEYAREGIASEPHTWLQCTQYPLDHRPAWGNLIFVPESDSSKFQETLKNYLLLLNQPKPGQWLRQKVAKIPGVRKFYRRMKRN